MTKGAIHEWYSLDFKIENDRLLNGPLNTLYIIQRVEVTCTLCKCSDAVFSKFKLGKLSLSYCTEFRKCSNDCETSEPVVFFEVFELTKETVEKPLASGGKKKVREFKTKHDHHTIFSSNNTCIKREGKFTAKVTSKITENDWTTNKEFGDPKKCWARSAHGQRVFDGEGGKEPTDWRLADGPVGKNERPVSYTTSLFADCCLYKQALGPYGEENVTIEN